MCVRVSACLCHLPSVGFIGFALCAFVSVSISIWNVSAYKLNWELILYCKLRTAEQKNRRMIHTMANTNARNDEINSNFSAISHFCRHYCIRTHSPPHDMLLFMFLLLLSSSTYVLVGRPSNSYVFIVLILELLPVPVNQHGVTIIAYNCALFYMCVCVCVRVCVCECVYALLHSQSCYYCRRRRCYCDDDRSHLAEWIGNKIENLQILFQSNGCCVYFDYIFRRPIWLLYYCIIVVYTNVNTHECECVGELSLNYTTNRCIHALVVVPINIVIVFHQNKTRTTTTHTHTHA